MDIGYLILEGPAWLVGHAIGALLVIGLLCGILVIAYYAGAAMYRLIRIPYLRVVLAVFVGMYVTAVLYRSITWAGVVLVQYADHAAE